MAGVDIENSVGASRVRRARHFARAESAGPHLAWPAATKPSTRARCRAGMDGPMFGVASYARVALAPSDFVRSRKPSHELVADLLHQESGARTDRLAGNVVMLNSIADGRSRSASSNTETVIFAETATKRRQVA